MKKAISILTYVLFALTILYPAGVIITARFGYSFELISISAFAIVIAVISVCIFALTLVFENTPKTKTMQVLSAIIAPLSLINAVFYMLECPKIWVVASVWISACCCCHLTAEYGKPLALKIVSLVLFSLMILPVGLFSFMSLTFGNIAQDTVVQTIDSPSGEYYAQVIDSDQGALGGDTHVDVYKYKNSGINAILFKIKKNPQRVYFGDWGEFERMQIYWKDDEFLVINSVEYKIK